MSELTEYIEEWCKGKSPWWRASLLVLLVYQWVRHIGDPQFYGVFSPINLGLHELGHLVFQPFGEWMLVAGGTIVEAAAPIASAVMFFRQPDFFAIAVCGGWMSTVLFGVAAYMGDAVKLELPVVTIGGAEPLTPNDWRYLLDSIGLLYWDTRLANGLRFIASVVMIGSLAYGVWLVWKMARPGAALHAGGVPRN